MSVGKTVLTKQGLLALTDASRGLIKPAPKYYKVSATDVGDLYNGIDLTDLPGVWKTGEIAGVVPVDENTTEFIIDIPPEEAQNYGKTFGLYLENGVLFAVAKPPYPFAPQLRQTMRIQIVWSGVNEILDFQYIPFWETEQYLALFDHSATALEIFRRQREEIESLKLIIRDLSARISTLERRLQT